MIRNPEGILIQMIKQTWDWLADQPEDAAELAQLLFEATPRLGVSASSSSPRKSIAQKSSKRSVPGASLSLLDRLKAAEPMATGEPHFYRYGRIRMPKFHEGKTQVAVQSLRLSLGGMNSIFLRISLRVPGIG